MPVFTNINILLLIPEGDISLSNVEGIHHIFTEANKWLQRHESPLFFDLKMVGRQKSHTMKDNYFSVQPDLLLHEVSKCDLVIIPALHTDVMKGLSRNKNLIPWIKELHQNGAQVMSLCTGAFLLAATGLLDGKQCTTHWIHARELQDHFPEVKVIDDEIITDEEGIYTSGAAYSYLNLIMYFIEKYAGRELVLFLAKVFAIDINRHSQADFIIFDGYKKHADQVVLNSQCYIETHFEQSISVEELAKQVAVGRRSFERRFRAATGMPVIAYVQRVRVEAAKKQLESEDITIQEVMFDVGYTDTKAFREVFKKITGLTPLNYKNKFSRAKAIN